MEPTQLDGGAGFFEENYDRIHRYVCGMVRDAKEGEDLTQETFLRAYRERASLRDPGAMLSWLYRIATHVCLDRLRQRRSGVARMSQAEPDDLEPPDASTPTMDEALARAEMSACVQRFLVDLSDTYRTVILLHDCHGLSGPEIAAALDLPVSTVKIRLHRARRRLRSVLETGCQFSRDERGVLVCEPRE
jgi:RNA polymerase sigma-70 factor (ECF subfamily)